MSIPFSEAIRLGAMLKPQGFGMGRTADVACAFDAAWLATVGDGASPNERFRYRIVHWPFLTDSCTCPVCSTTECLDHIVSAHLNDKHRWTREQIADFVATIEAQQAQPEALAEEVVSR